MSGKKIFPDEIRNFVLENHEGIPPNFMTEIVNRRFGTSYTKEQLHGYYKTHRLKAGIDGRTMFKLEFEGKTYEMANLGQFRLGNMGITELPVGSIRKDSRGYWKKKVNLRPPVWRHLHKLIWEEANGPIPEGSIIIFKDGNTDNYQLDNLMCITRKENRMLNAKHLRSSDAETTETAVLLAKLIIAKQDREKGDKK